MSYLTKQEYNSILNEVKFVSIKAIDDISCFLFDSNVEEYNSFLRIAKVFDDMDVSKTFLLFHRKTQELLAYMSVSADSIKLTRDEKEMHNISKVPYAAVPALKIGKLAVNKTVSDVVRRKDILV